MSYILDALKRAERERSAAMPEQTGAIAAPAQRRLRPTTMALAGATLFLAGIGVAVLLLRPTAPAQAPMPAQIAPAPTFEAAPTAVPSASAIAQPVLGDAAALTAYESLDDVSPVFQGSPTSPAVTPEATMPATATVTIPAPAASTRTDSAPASRPSASSATAPARNLPPRLAQMPEEYQSRFPSPLIQVHVFDAEPSRRWIMVDNRRQGEGGVLDSGLRIAEIVSDGVIFEFAGSQVYWPLNR